MDAVVRQDGNRFTADFGRGAISFEISGPACAPSASAEFAIWLLLPVAMKAGEHLRLRGAADPVVLDNARQLARIWAMWLPEEYSLITVTADSERPLPAPAGGESVLLFSGGVDSTYALLTEKARASISHVLTVHGLDYNYEKDGPFGKLTAKTAPFLRETGVERITVRTDAARYLGDLALTHAFALAACLFLCSRRFGRGLLAADLTPAKEMMVFPWGTNHITNTYFASSSYRMETVSGGVSRIAKLEYLLGHPSALRSLSFCGVRANRPENCGVCEKCVRTKIMFLALGGDCPDIFAKRGITEQDVRRLNAIGNLYYPEYSEALRVARERGFLKCIPGFEGHMARAIAARRRRRAAAELVAKIGRRIGLG